MDITRQNGTLSVTDLRELNAENADSFQSAIGASLADDLRTIEIDLSQTQVVDGAGLGALVYLYEAAKKQIHPHTLSLRLKHPVPTVQQMLELARLHHFFEILPSPTSKLVD
jgi:anti-anti-sigma factor